MKRRVINIDYETFSHVDLLKVGSFRYAEDPTTEILMMAMAEGDEDPVLWIPEAYSTSRLYTSDRAIQILESLSDPAVEVHAFNAQFEVAITQSLFEKQTGFAPPHWKQFRCTAAVCRKASLPADLAGAARALGLKMQKDESGKGFIDKFSKPYDANGKRGKKAGEMLPLLSRCMPQEDPAAFEGFAEYCRQDVRVERAIKSTLQPFELSGFSLEAFLFDLSMNMRGFPVNVDALEKTLRIIQEQSPIIIQEFESFVGLRPTQNVRLLAWLQARGYPHDNLQADTIEEFLEMVEDGEQECSYEVAEALRLKQLIAFAATSKVQAMLNCACRDGRVRGVFMYHGARTGRWSAKYVQPHNYKRPTALDKREEFTLAFPERKHEVKTLFGPPTNAEAYKAIRNGLDRAGIEALFGPPLEVISACIRHFIQRPSGMLFDADYASIEARVVCWLAYQEDMLEMFRKNAPMYEEMAAFIFNTSAASIGKNSLERFIGKQTVLGCGFGMGPPKFIKTCAKFGQHIDSDLAKRAVYGYRQKFKKVADLWSATERAAQNALNAPGKQFTAGRLRFFATNVAGFKYMMLKLPSGRLLSYPDMKIHDDGQMSFFGLVKGKTWGRIGTYGAKLVENATQAVAADVMTVGSLNAEMAGYHICGLIHDQALCEPRPGQTIEEFCRLLTALPMWADGLPVVAEGQETEFYTK